MDNNLVLIGAQAAIPSFCDQHCASALLEGNQQSLTDYDYIDDAQAPQDDLLISQNGMVSASNPSSRMILKLLELVPSLTACEPEAEFSSIEKTGTGFCGISEMGKATYWDRVITLDGQVSCKSRTDGADWPFDNLV